MRPALATVELGYSDELSSSTPRPSIMRRSSSVVSAVVVLPVVTTYKCIRRWQFWVFDVLPILLALGISIEVFFLAQKREKAEAADDFRFRSVDAFTSLNLALELTLKNAQFLLSDIVANGMPTAHEFERFAFSNSYFNMEKTITRVMLISVVYNASRGAYPDPIITVPDFTKPWAGQPTHPSHVDFVYFPIRYVSPPQPSIIGMDMDDDPILDSFVHLVSGTGQAAVTPTYTLRTGIAAANATEAFMSGFSYLLPFFQSVDGGLTTQQTANMGGVVCTVIWITGVLRQIMQQLSLAQMDVFLFDVTDPDAPTYVAHYETPEANRPYYTPENVSDVTPFNLEGDFVSEWSKQFDLSIAQRRYRLRTRARTDMYVPRFSTELPYILLGLSLAAKALDKFMHAIHMWKFNNEAHS